MSKFGTVETVNFMMDFDGMRKGGIQEIFNCVLCGFFSFLYAIVGNMGAEKILTVNNKNLVVGIH